MIYDLLIGICYVIGRRQYKEELSSRRPMQLEGYIKVWLILVACFIALRNFSAGNQLFEKTGIMHVKPRLSSIR